MLLRIGLETNFEGRSLAWALDFPGCYAYGQDSTEALLRMPRALVDYQAWAGRHAAQSWLADLGDFDVRLVETWDDYTINESYDPAAEGRLITAWFRNDWKPLSVLEVRQAAQLLEWSRADLLAVIDDLTDELLDRPVAGERWSIRGIIAHLATFEWWMMDQLGVAETGRANLPKDPRERLLATRASLHKILPDLAGLDRVVGKGGELWSARRLVRRVLWHERDHLGHILKLI